MKKNEAPLTGGLNKKKKESGVAFYAFEAKDSKLKSKYDYSFNLFFSEAQELQQKFAEDKRRIEQLKKARNFKPF